MSNVNPDPELFETLRDTLLSKLVSGEVCIRESEEKLGVSHD